jgi:putative redox protein
MSGSVVVRENGQGRYQQEVIVGQHRLVADEPVAVGGADAGPAPFELVMAGLGACTAMTVRMYAEHKEFSLTHIHVDVTHEKLVVAGVNRDRILRTLTLEGDLSAEQRARLVEIAGRCPTARLLSQPLLLECRLAD